MTAPRSAAIKRIYFARRHPSIAQADFIARWRAHGQLAMSFMASHHWVNVARYVQCDAVRDAPPVPGVDPGWDGMGIVVFPDPAARERHVANLEWRAVLHADEEAVFAQRVDRTGLLAHEQVVLEGSEQGLKLVRAFRRAGDDAAPPDELAMARYAERVRATCGPALSRQVFDWPLASPAPWGLDVDLVEELWFSDGEGLAAAVERGLCAVTPGLQLETAMVVREHVLFPPQGS